MHDKLLRFVIYGDGDRRKFSWDPYFINSPFFLVSYIVEKINFGKNKISTFGLKEKTNTFGFLKIYRNLGFSLGSSSFTEVGS